MTRNDTPAFPFVIPKGDFRGEVVCKGMTLRDYFAAKAMAVLAHPDMLPGTGKADLETLAVAFYSMADAMLAEREREAR